MGAENRLHFFRMCAWGMFDPDALQDPRERKVRTRQIRHVFQECGFHLQINRYNYAVYKGDPQYSQTARLLKVDKSLPSLCEELLPIVDAKFPPNPQ